MFWMWKKYDHPGQRKPGTWFEVLLEYAKSKCDMATLPAWVGFLG